MCRYFPLTLHFFFNGVCIVKRKGAVESNGGVYRTVLEFYASYILVETVPRPAAPRRFHGYWDGCEEETAPINNTPIWKNQQAIP